MNPFLPVEALGALSAQAQSMVASAAAQPSAPLAAAGDTGAVGGTFAQLVNEGVTKVNQQLMASQTDLQRLAVGDVQNLHQIMINMEESRLSFQVIMQVRGRLLEAYQDVMRMSL